MAPNHLDHAQREILDFSLKQQPALKAVSISGSNGYINNFTINTYSTNAIIPEKWVSEAWWIARYPSEFTHHFLQQLLGPQRLYESSW